MRDAWKRFIEEKEIDADLSPVIHRSWRRSREFNVAHERVGKKDFLPSSRLLERQQAHEDLVSTGKSLLPYLYNLLQGSNYMMLLTDNEGYILDALGDPAFMSKAQQVYLLPGASWREEIKGTNAIGTALTEKTPTQVLGWEHFVQENHFMSCWAAPIKNPQGEIAGILDISGRAEQANQRLLNLVIMGAHMFEQSLQLQELKRQLGVYREGVKIAGELLHQGFITIDNSGVVTDINPVGAQLLNRKPEDLVGHLASEVFGSPRGWVLSNQSLDLQIKKSGGEDVISRMRQVVDSTGKTMGIVGLLETALTEPDTETFWVGRSALTKKSFALAEKAARINSTVLITGESGTGKEVMARYIHHSSSRSTGPFVALNCAALPESLIGSELFGYDEGSFTGAKKGGQPGKFELADGGTIFLDEIGDMPLDVQVSLLRVLQEREVQRIGGNGTRKVDVRVIAATNRNLPALVSGGLFRLDLFYRLKVINIELPPLRQRVEDIWDLAPLFIHEFCQKFDKPPLTLTTEAYECLLAYSWPGNIRELENCIESMVGMADGPMLTIRDLPNEIAAAGSKKPAGEISMLDQQTRQTILKALSETNNKIAPAARLLGIGRNTLYRKLKELGIKQE